MPGLHEAKGNEAMSNDQFKVKSIPLRKRSRDEQLAAALYPNQSPYRKEVLEILASEGWKGSGKGLLSDATRGSTSPLDGRMKGSR